MIFTEVGKTYIVFFDLAGNPEAENGIKTMRLSVNGNPVSQDYSFDTSGRTVTNMGWETRSFIFTAGNVNTIIVFDSLSPGSYGPAIDNVRIEEFAAPFLTSPLAIPLTNSPLNSPYTMTINSVFDHNIGGNVIYSVDTGGPDNGPGTGYSTDPRDIDGVVRAFTNEVGDIPETDPITQCYADNSLFELASEFFLYGNYGFNGLAPPNRQLCYDGHLGMDFEAVNDVTKVFPSAPGEIVFMGCACGGFVNDGLECSPTCTDSLGSYIAIEHDNGFITYYGHLASFDPGISLNQTVGITDEIGVTGASGDAGGGGHLHFEVGLNDSTVVDPYGFMGVGNLWLPACSDGIDNDGDGNIDWHLDPGCTYLNDISEVVDCNDGIDNDLDGLIDYPDDMECPDSSGNSEVVPEPAQALMLISGCGLLCFLQRRRERMSRIGISSGVFRTTAQKSSDNYRSNEVH